MGGGYKGSIIILGGMVRGEKVDGVGGTALTSHAPPRGTMRIVRVAAFAPQLSRTISSSILFPVLPSHMFYVQVLSQSYETTRRR